MNKIIQLHKYDTDKILLVKRSLIGLRNYYPDFAKWYDSKIVPNVDNNREIFLSTKDGIFSGALILKNELNEKKICTLFVNPNNRFSHVGNDFLRIASEELETYKLPITISDDAMVYFNKFRYNFYEKKIVDNMYKQGSCEHIGYLMYHNPDNEYRRN